MLVNGMGCCFTEWGVSIRNRELVTGLSVSIMDMLVNGLEY